MPKPIKALDARGPVEVSYVQTAAAGTAPPAVVFCNPSTSGEYYEITDVSANFEVAGTSATVDVKIVPAATAIASGTSALSSTIDCSAGARTIKQATLTSTAGNRVVPPGSSVAVITGGTLTSLTGLGVMVTLRPLRGVHRR